MRRIAGEGLIVGASQLGVVLARVVTIWGLAHALSASAYGEVALLQGIAALGYSVACTPLLQAALRFEPEAVRDGRSGDLSGLLRPLVLRVAAFASLVIAVGVALWGLATRRADAVVLAALATAVILPDALRAYEANVLNARRLQRPYATWTLLDAVLRPVLVIAAVFAIAPTSLVALAATLVAAVLSYLIPRVWLSAPVAPPTGDPAWSVRTRARVRSFVLPLVPFFALAWIIGLGDRFVIGGLSGAAAAGIYAAAYGLASQGFLALGTVGLTMFRPLFLSATDAGDTRRARRVILAWAACLTAGSVAGIGLLAALGPWLTDTLLGPAFAEAAPLLPWIGGAYAFQALQTMLEVLIYARHRTAQLLVVQATGAAVAALLYAVLIPRWGMHGAALATLGSFVASSFAAALLGDLAGVLRAREIAR